MAAEIEYDNERNQCKIREVFFVDVLLLEAALYTFWKNMISIMIFILLPAKYTIVYTSVVLTFTIAGELLPFMESPVLDDFHWWCWCSG